MAIKIPSYLKPGDTIGITCPAGYMDFKNAEECISVLQKNWGYKVKIGNTLGGSSTTYFSGSDEERLADFQAMLDDDEVDAVLCGRGGYGMGRIIDRISFKKFIKKPKWVAGYSDITVFHNHVNKNLKIATLHAPMAAAFNDKGYLNKYVKSLKTALEGEKAIYSCRTNKRNHYGKAKAELVGGNLALFVHTIGTKSEPVTKGKILFLEDVGEQKYNLDRMMYQLKRSGKLDNLAGLILGRFTDVQDTTRPFGEDVQEIMHQLIKEYKYPVCYDFPVSHDKENFALKVGGTYQLQIDSKKVLLSEK
ncbi:MAG: LD-carboxypeptidase [Niabella sp.]